jgi:multidrug efflux pump subunit AcrB
VLQSDQPLEQMVDTVGAVVGAGWKSGKFLYVDTDLKVDQPQARVEIDRERIADLGLDLASVGRELGTLLGGAYVNRFNYFAATRSSRRSATRTARRSARCSISRSRRRPARWCRSPPSPTSSRPPRRAR